MVQKEKVEETIVMSDPRTLEAFSRCKDRNEYDELCDSVRGCAGCSLIDFGQDYGIVCIGDHEITLSKVNQVIRKQKLEKLLS